MNIERVLSDVDKDISMDQSPTASEATLKGQADSDEMAASLISFL